VESVEIEEYAQFLGMDVAAEPHLVWIAQEGLRAPLPADWKPWSVCMRATPMIFYSVLTF
jgi:centrosomal protein CEP164